MNIYISVTFVTSTLESQFRDHHIIIYPLLDQVSHTYADFILVRYLDMRSLLPMMRIFEIVDTSVDKRNRPQKPSTR